MFGLSPSQGAAFIFGGISVLLGFAALLMQKVYLDPNSERVTNVEAFNVKFQTNIPALFFVALGFALAGYAYYQSVQYSDIWTIEASFVPAPGEAPITPSEMSRLKNGKIIVQPSRLVAPPEIEDDGIFRFPY